MTYIKKSQDETYPPNFKFGSKNVSALLVPHAGSKFVKEILDFVFDKINIKRFNKIILLTTNHSTRDNLQISGIPVDSNFFRHEHSYLSILPYLEKIGLVNS